MTKSICLCDCFLNIISSFFQTEQMKRIGNELDSVHFSLKKASQMVKEIGRQVLPRSLALKCFFFGYSYVAEFTRFSISGCY